MFIYLTFIMIMSMIISCASVREAAFMRNAASAGAFARAARQKQEEQRSRSGAVGLTKSQNPGARVIPLIIPEPRRR